MFARPSPVGRQVMPLSSLFQTPPDTPAANSVVCTIGWKRTTRVRPPMLPGPSGVQASRIPVTPLRSVAATTRLAENHTRECGCESGSTRLMAEEKRPRRASPAVAAS